MQGMQRGQAAEQLLPSRPLAEHRSRLQVLPQSRAHSASTCTVPGTGCRSITPSEDSWQQH